MSQRKADEDMGDVLYEDDDFLQCPHEAGRATCAGGCNCPCDPCAPSRSTQSRETGAWS